MHKNAIGNSEFRAYKKRWILHCINCLLIDIILDNIWYFSSLDENKWKMKNSSTSWARKKSTRTNHSHLIEAKMNIFSFLRARMVQFMCMHNTSIDLKWLFTFQLFADDKSKSGNKSTRKRWEINEQNPSRFSNHWLDTPDCNDIKSFKIYVFQLKIAFTSRFISHGWTLITANVSTRKALFGK